MSFSIVFGFTIIVALCSQSFENNKPHVRSLLSETRREGADRATRGGATGGGGAAGGGGGATVAAERPNIHIQGNYSSTRPHALREAAHFLSAYNTDNRWQHLKQLRLVIIGDQGGWPKHKEGTTVPSDQYIATAKAIGVKHRANPYHAMFTTGDNIYSDGINLEDLPLMAALTNEVMRGNGLNNLPWFFVLGNHDHCKDPYAQVEYSRREILKALRESVDYPVVILPDYFYSVRFEFSSKIIYFQMIDSMVNRAELDPYNNCHAAEYVQEKKANYKNHLKPEQTKWSRANLEELLALSGSHYNILLTHHGAFSTMKWRGCDETLKFLSSLGTEAGEYIFDAVIGGHDHGMEFGEVFDPLLRSAVIGGTRSCDAIGGYNRGRDLLLDVPAGRGRKALAGYFDRQRWQYWWNSWRDCKYGGFVELIFDDVGRDKPVKVTMIFYSGHGDELKRYDISTPDMSNAEDVAALRARMEDAAERAQKEHGGAERERMEEGGAEARDPVNLPAEPGA